SGTVVEDFSGNGNRGIIVGTPGVWITGKLGKAYDFQQVNGSCSTGSNCINAGSAASLDNIRQITVMAWIAPDDVGDTSAGSIVTKYGCGTDGWELKLDTTSRFAFSYQWTGGIGRWRTTNNLSPFFGTTFQHVAVTYNSAASTNDPILYYNGASVAVSETNTPASSPDNDAANNLHIGIGCGTYEFDGRIDEVRVYNRILSAAEIKTLYQSGATKANSSQNLQLTSGLVGMWSFNGPDITDNQILDVSGNGNHGGFFNGATSSATVIGKVGQALQFDGNNDYIKVPSSTVFDSTTSTWCTWFKTSGGFGAGTGTSDSTMLGRHNTASSVNGVNLLMLTNGNIEFDIKNATTWASAPGTSGQNYIDSSWHHVCALTAPNGGTAYIYVDGVQKASDAVSSAWSFNSQVVRFADSVDTYWGQYKGQLDEPRIYNRALSATEVKQLYNMGR
ncbi:MAG: LamG domain-containing protein, partial [Patescibacteria group bacterium]